MKNLIPLLTLMPFIFLIIEKYLLRNLKKANDNAIEKEFNRLAERWKQNIEFYSLANLVYSDENHLKIIGMGEKVLPYIFKDLEKTQNFWFYALIQITGERPVKEEDKGDNNKMTKCWLEWAKLKKIEF